MIITELNFKKKKKFELSSIYTLDKKLILDWSDVNFNNIKKSKYYKGKENLSNLEIIFWNDDAQIGISIPINQNNFIEKKILISHYDELKSLYSENIDLIIFDMYLKAKVKNNEFIYSFCRRIKSINDNLNKEFINFELCISHDNEAKEIYLLPRYTKNENLLIELIDKTIWFKELRRKNYFINEILDINFINISSNKILIKLKELNENINEKSILNYFLYNEKSKIMEKGKALYNSKKNLIIIENEILKKLKKLYNNKKVRLRFFVSSVNQNSSLLFQFKICDKINFKEDIYDRTNRYMNAGVIGEKNKETIVLLPYMSLDKTFLKLVILKQNEMLSEQLDAKVVNLFMIKNFMYIKFELPNYGYEVKRIYAKLRNPLILKEENFDFTVKKKGDLFNIIARLDFEKVKFTQFYWDIKCVLSKNNSNYEIHLRNYSGAIQKRMYFKKMQYKFKNSYVAFPYETKSHNFAITYRQITKQDNILFILKEYLALLIYYALRPYWIKKNIWLVYEKYCLMAQDNSYYFFKYCMEKLPREERKRIFYVIDKKCTDYQYVKDYGKNKIINFLSLRHMIYLKASKILISSDTKAHSYAWHSPNTIYRNMINKNRNVFLQHGVIYFKQCHQGLKKQSTNSCRLFITSSKVERDIVNEYFGYDLREITVSGLARWDVLKDTSKKHEKQIFFMPTWRTWLEEVTEREFKQSDYYKYYMSVLNNYKLIEILETYDVTLNFYIHPKFREYISAFNVNSDSIRIINFGSEPMNKLLMSCNMMITDYSSACWDVFYQSKPVLFYLFDLELYNKVQGSYINIEKEAFGETAKNSDELIFLIEKYIKNDFTEEEKYAKMRKELIPFIDNNNSERIYKAIKSKKFLR